MLSPTLAVYRNLLSNQGFLWLFSVFKRLRNSLETGLLRPAPQVSATAVLACSTAPGLAPAPNTRNGQQIILKVAKDTESRRTSKMRSARIIQLRLPLCPLTEEKRPSMLRRGKSGF